MAFLSEYTLLCSLGKGGFAEVFKVRHNELGYIRAVRVLNETVTDGSSLAYQSFLRECKVLLRLGNGSHSNIVHIYQPRLLENRALVEMDYVDGCNLYQYLQKNKFFLPTNEVVRMAREMSDALAYCHEDIYEYCIDMKGDNLKPDPVDGSKPLVDAAKRTELIEKYKVIHNDIHSGNIMRRRNGGYVLLDFGLAIEGDETGVSSSRRKNGAVEYLPPEKLDFTKVLSTQSDIYSFGVVMYEFLAGRVPFPKDSRITNEIEQDYLVGKAHKEQIPPSIFEIRKSRFEEKFPGRSFEKDYPDWLEQAIMRCLEKDPSNRFSNGKELYEFIVSHMAQDSRDETLEKELAEQKDAVKKLTDELMTLKSKPEAKIKPNDVQKLEQENRQLKEHIGDLSTTLNLVNEQNERLKKTNNKKGKALTIFVILFSVVFAALVAGLVLYKPESKGETNQTEAYEEMKKKYEEAEKALSESEENVEQLEKEIEKLNKQIGEMEQGGVNYSSLIEEKKKEIDRLNGTINDLNAKIKDNKNALDANAKSLLDKQSEINKLKKQLKETDNTKLKNEITKLKNENEKLVKQIIDMRKKG